jgi:1-deoxyxylulose-5-phosphate synthase
MKHRKLGNTGLDVSPICLGCMSFGSPDRGAHPWTLGLEASLPLIRQALDAGINFLDTANVYSDGTSEEMVGQAIADYGRRDDLVIATKVHGHMRGAPNGSGLSRKAIMAELDHSLRRLGTDYVDLYQIHRWDFRTPIEETMQALHDVVRSGKVRYIGASSMDAWQFSKAQYTAKANGLTPFVSMQNHYNLLYREEEREMIPLCVDQGVALIPWSPLARGRLARDWDAATARTETDEFGKTLYLDSDKLVVDAVAKVADARGVPRAQIAMAWLLGKRFITSPIFGATRASQVDDAVAAVDIKLSTDEVAVLESAYAPHAVAGHQTSWSTLRA